MLHATVIAAALSISGLLTDYAEPPVVLPEDAIDLLVTGNQRWVSGSSMNRHSTAERLRETAEQGQEPFATVVACSDSRVPVEMVFDRGVGDLFVVRVLGDAYGPDTIASVDHGVEVLNTPVIVALDHNEYEDAEARVFESMARVITGSEIVRERIMDNRIVVIGGVYDLHSGRIRFIGEHPEQAALLRANRPALTEVPEPSER